MNTRQDMPQMTREQFELESTALAIGFLSVLSGRTVSSGVVLQAVMEVHRCVARQMPLDAQAELSMAMAAYAGELMQGLKPAPIPNPSQSANLH